MPDMTVHNALLVVALGILLCLGWSALSAVWAWVTRAPGGIPPERLGLVILIIVFVALAWWGFR